MFDLCCNEHGIEHRLTMELEATMKRYYYASHSQLKTHLHSFMMVYNFARRLKTLKGLTPYEYIMAVPEPETYAMLIAGLGLIGFSARRHRAM